MDRPLKLSWLSWEADQANGYGRVGLALRNAVGKAGAEIMDPRDFGWDALVCVSTPAAFFMGREERREDIVFHTMFEAEPIPPRWRELMNMAGAVWVPSSYCERIFREEGVTVPIFKAGYGIDHTQFPYVERSGRQGPMKFGIWAETLVSRKNVLMAAQAFVAANLPPDEAVLEIKINNTLGWNPNISFTDAVGAKRDNIKLHAGSWPWQEMLAWLHEIDCGIYLSGGEGFGLMPLEMMATGMPVIVADNTGMQEYVSPAYCLPVPCPTMMRAVSYEATMHYPVQIHKPDFDAAVAQIRWAFEHREEAYAMGKTASVYSELWNWKHVGQQALDELTKLYG